jgi:hypothetical protein
MYMSQALARDRYLAEIEQAHHARIAYQAARLRKIQRIRERAERRLLRAWERADAIRATIETS